MFFNSEFLLLMIQWNNTEVTIKTEFNIDDDLVRTNMKISTLYLSFPKQMFA